MSIIAELRALASGDTLHGLEGKEVARKAATFSTARLVELRAVEVSKREAYERAMDEARRREEQAKKNILAKRNDEGQSSAGLVFPNWGPAVTAVVNEFIAQNRAEFALRDIPGYGDVSARDVLDAIHHRVTTIEEELARRYVTEGEPVAAVELRRELSRAIRAAWAARRALDEAKREHQGCRLPETEAACFEAADAEQKASAECDRLRRELWNQFAITVR